MNNLRQIAPGTYVAGQIIAEDIAAAASAGIKRVVNNRPDGEDPNQPDSSAMEKAVREAGLDYVHVPITGMPGRDQVEAVTAVLSDGQPTLLYCRSGMRSVAVWAMATAASGHQTPDAVRQAASDAGYDLSRLPL